MINLYSKIFGLKQFNRLCGKLIKFESSSYRTINDANDQQQQIQQTSQTRTHNYRQNQRKDINQNKQLFRHQSNKKSYEKKQKIADDSQTNVEEFIKNINEINKEFLGIKLNTNYFKIYNEKRFEQLLKPDLAQAYKINDLPFNVKSKSQNEENQKTQVSQLQDNLATKMFRKMISQERITKQLQSLVKNYFKDLISRERKCRMEPNFQMYARRVVETLKSKNTTIKLVNADLNPKIVLKNVTMFKGVKINRNDNYSLDSYQLNNEQEKQSIITYTLWKKQRQQYPQNQWSAQKFIMARIEADVSNAPIIEVTEPSSIISSNDGVTHSFVFEVDLSTPPSLSALSLSAEEYLNAYRLKPESIHISNVDNKNIYFNLAFKEEDKKNKLINKII